MSDMFDEFADCDEGYGESVPEPTLDADGYPQVRSVSVVTRSIVNCFYSPSNRPWCL